MDRKTLKLVYVTPALYMAGGVERVLTLKANYFAEHDGYDVTIVLTEGKGKPLFYPLSDKVKVINLGLDFEELWTCSFLRKIPLYLKKQRRFRRLLTQTLLQLRPDITVSMLRREINFINEIKDGSRKIGELHVNRANYRNYNTEHPGILKRVFSYFWSRSLLSHLKKLDYLVVLTEHDRKAWVELDHVTAIPDPLPFTPSAVSPMTHRRVVAIARYAHEKGIDLLLEAWAMAEKQTGEWRLDVYGDGDRAPYEQLLDKLHIDRQRCALHGRTSQVEQEYRQSSLFVLSSRFEGFGMVIIEAMACGLPVVAFDCPWGPRSIISDGADGLLAANGDVADLAQKLSLLMADDARRTAMAAAARQNVGRFQMAHVARKWNALFAEVMNK